MIISLGLAFLAVFFTGIGQVLLKIGSQSEGIKERFFTAYLNVYTLGAYAIFLMVTIISVIALLEIPLKLFYAISSLIFVVVTFLSWTFLKEVINRRMVLGIMIIVIGNVVFNL